MKEQQEIIDEKMEQAFRKGNFEEALDFSYAYVAYIETLKARRRGELSDYGITLNIE